ncbi:MAG: hypothetical protein PHH11_13590, partial [Methylomonas sp.]|nr:hypothetical protein [Methylomonas sp.]
AYEADIVNLLVGPLSEAKYVALRDGEIFNRQLVNLNAMRHYGGHSDIVRAQQYLEYFLSSKSQREQKLDHLLSEAFEFIDNPKHWKCIASLAQFILDNRQETISCDEAIAIFEHSLSSTQYPRWSNQVSCSGR